MEVSGEFNSDGDFTIVSNKDALHSENEEDERLDYLYVNNGNISIYVTDDGISATGKTNGDVTVNGELITEITQMQMGKPIRK